ncbi:9483_t:CDS:2 [Funneliformis geosporum]|nr:9483_t:CDS:2 [Funneliformis geosporum]
MSKASDRILADLCNESIDIDSNLENAGILRINQEAEVKNVGILRIDQKAEVENIDVLGIDQEVGINLKRGIE